jgi:hypothetical protein
MAALSANVERGVTFHFMSLKHVSDEFVVPDGVYVHVMCNLLVR